MLSQLLYSIPRYVFVAAFCALLHNSILIAADAIGLHYIVCQIASAAVLTPTAYLLQGHYVFRSTPDWLGFVRYSGLSLTNFPVAILLLWALRDLLSLPMVIAAPVSTIFLCVWNYMTSCWAFWQVQGQSNLEKTR